MTVPRSAAAVPGPAPARAVAAPRVWVFTTSAPVADCWLRADLARQVAHDRLTAALLYAIYHGSRLPFTITREELA